MVKSNFAQRGAIWNRRRHTITLHLHRWLGLVGGVLLCTAGLTGAVLVFWHEIDHWVIAQRFGAVIPNGAGVPVAEIVNTVRDNYPNLTLNSLTFPDGADQPYTAWLLGAGEQYWQVFINPFSGLVMGDREWHTSWVGRIYDLHYKLLAGDGGILVMGMVALGTLVLSVTGIILWPGWYKLIAGFRIRWQKVHIKRLNYDIHKVAGIVTAVFLALIGFTGFAWNVPQAKVTEAIHAITLTPKPIDPVSQPIPGKKALSIAELLPRADRAVPDAKIIYVVFPKKPEDALRVGKRQAQETDKWGNTRVYLDQFSGEVIRLQDGTKPNRAEAILNQFGPVHFGTFWGIPSRIFYVLVGWAPTVLMGTGVVMWLYRRRTRTINHS